LRELRARGLVLFRAVDDHAGRVIEIEMVGSQLATANVERFFGSARLGHLAKSDVAIPRHIRWPRLCTSNGDLKLDLVRDNLICVAGRRIGSTLARRKLRTAQIVWR